MKVNIKFFGLFFCLPSMAFSQNGNEQRKLPSVDYEPRPPLVASFARYGEIPVDYSTGVPNIEIPIHTVKVGDTEVPIKITYHASGIKVRDVASEVGLGFALQTGGALTSTVLGMDDSYDTKEKVYRTASEINHAIYETGPLTQQQLTALSDHFRRILNGQYIRDHFSDRFQYQLATGESGVFRLDYLTGEPRLLPYRPIKIDYRSNEIGIVSADGYDHLFTRGSPAGSYVFKKLVAPTRADSVVYHYQQYVSNSYPWLNVEYSGSWSDKFCKLVNAAATEGAMDLECEDLLFFKPEVTGGLVYSDSPLLDSLVSDREVIQFDYSTGRQDDCYGNMGSFRRLTKITIRDRRSRKVSKVFNFHHSYFGSQQNNNRRLRLDKISISGDNSQDMENYTFVYNTEVELPNYPSTENLGLFNTQTWHEDHWGYYNGSSNSHLFPSSMGIPNYSLPMTNMNPNFHFAKACILTEIKYPTGGRTTFEYEAHDLQHLGGLRIKKISSYSSDTAPPQKKEYLYSSPIVNPINFNTYKWESPQEYYMHYKRNWPNYIRFIDSQHLYKAFSKSLLPTGINYGPAVVYAGVTEVFGEGTTNIGKIVYNYEYPDSEETRYPRPGDIDAKYLGYYHADLGNYIPRLSAKELYKFENGQYILVESENNSYERYRSAEFYTGISLGSKIVLQSFSDDEYTVLLNYIETSGRRYLNDLVYSDTKGFEEAVLLKSTISKTYSNGSPVIEKTTVYDYDADYTLLSSRSWTSSDGGNGSEEIRYPFDYNTLPYTNMVARNILSVPIEQSVYKNGNSLESMKTEFGFWYNGAWTSSISSLILPKKIETRVGAGTVRQEILYDRYDGKGNVGQVTSKNESPIVYIWGYKGQYPVAKVENATYTEVASVLGATFINNLNSGNVTDAEIRQRMDVLRSHTSMRKAQVTSYTYQPLVGMKSMTDPKGTTESYEYDSFGRLAAVVDHEGNILETYCYNYAGQQVDCFEAPTVYKNNAVSRVFRKNNCPEGQIGTNVTYTVPIGRYTSVVSLQDANSQAEQDVLLNGQQYANNYGDCVDELLRFTTGYGGNTLSGALAYGIGNPLMPLVNLYSASGSFARLITNPDTGFYVDEVGSAYIEDGYYTNFATINTTTYLWYKVEDGQIVWSNGIIW